MQRSLFDSFEISVDLCLAQRLLKVLQKEMIKFPLRTLMQFVCFTENGCFIKAFTTSSKSFYSTVLLRYIDRLAKNNENKNTKKGV